MTKLNLTAACIIAALTPCACVRRTLTINTEPQGALVYLNDQPIGPTPVSRDFTWYGDYDVVIRKDGYETLKTNFDVRAPWYQRVPFDFFFDALWPGQIHDQRFAIYTLNAWTPPDEDQVIERAMELRDQALFGPR